MKRIFPLLLLLLPMAIHGQDCAQSLRLAKATYDQGKLHEVEQYLQGCISGGTLKEKEDALKLLCLTQIYLEEPEKADEAMLNLLRTNNYFTYSEVDPAEFIALYKTFRTREIYRAGAFIGLNSTSPQVTQRITTCTQCTGSYSSQIGFMGGATLEVPLSDKLAFNPQLMILQRRISFENEVQRTGGLVNNTTGSENQTWISLPIGIQYNLLNKGYRPYLSGGFIGEYLLNSELTTITTQDQAAGVQEKTIDIGSMRKSFLGTIYAGAGIRLRLFGGYVYAEARYLYGLNTVNALESAFNITGPAFNNNWGDSIFRVNSITFTAGYIQNVFNPKKLKRK